MRVRAISGYGVKGPACFLVEHEGRRIILDMGEGPDAGARPVLDGIGPVDAILISHGHPDHVGALDLAARVGNPPIHVTRPVRALADSAVLKAARDLPFEGTAEIAGLAIETGRAGHAPGGVWIRIGGADGLLYTGDFSREGTLYPFVMPPKTRLMIFDASYATHDVALQSGIEQLVAQALRRPVLLPVPAGGRGLEMAIVFAEARIEVGLCPAHWHVAETLLAPDVPGLTEEGRERLASALRRARRLDAASPAAGAMIAAKPNANGGLAKDLAERFAETDEADIVFTGHLSQGTPSAALVEAGKASFVRWNVHPRLSDMAALLDWVTPEKAMPAFVSADKLAGLAQALPGSGIVLADTLS